MDGVKQLSKVFLTSCGSAGWKRSVAFAMLTMLLFLGTGISRQLIGELTTNMGYVALAKGDVFTAHSRFTADSIQKTNSLAAREGLMRSELLLGQFDTAGSLFGEICFSRDNVLLLWVIRQAERSLHSGESAYAVSTLNVLLQCDEIRQPEFWYHAGEIYESAGAVDKAEYVYHVGIGRDPAGYLAKGWYYLGRLYYLKQEWQSAVNTIAPVVSAAPDSVLDEPHWRESRLILAQSLHFLDRDEEAEAIYLRLIRSEPSTRTWVDYYVLLALGDLEAKRSKFAAAAAHFAQSYDIAVKIPEHSRMKYEEQAWQSLVWLLDQTLQQQRLDELARQTQVSLVEFPNSPGWWVLMGLISEGDKHMGAALAAYEAALELAPQSFYLPIQLKRMRAIGR